MIYSGSYNGLAFGPATSFPLNLIAGLDDMPPVRSTDALRSQDHGAWAGTDLAGERTITLGFMLTAANAAALDALADQVSAAFVVQPAELPLLYNGSTRRIMCRPRRLMIPRDLAANELSAKALVELVATDPRKYNATETSISTGLPTNSGGMTFPAAFPLAFGAAGTGGYIQAANAGNFPTRPVITIAGPVDNPTVTNQTAGKSLTFAITLAVTDTLTIDLDARSVTLNGTASRRNTLAPGSQWWELAPGQSTIRYTANTALTGSVMTLTYRDAWL